MENMFGDILSDLAGGLVGGMGMAPCGEIGDDTGLFQPAHGSAPDLIGCDAANPIAATLSGALMLDYLAEKINNPILHGIKNNRYVYVGPINIHISKKAVETVVNECIEKKITKVYFDRGAYKYHGRIKMFADSLRKNGMEF